jgi:N-acetylglucosaminyl-diphospho-decaprenol L-rhamnosyltransferase
VLDIAIVIVNYNVCDLLQRCLDTVFNGSEGVHIAVCVVDNQSSDGSVAMVRALFPQVHLIVNEENVGYPAANNQGLRALGMGERSEHLAARPTAARPTAARYALLLNPDTELPPDALAVMVRYMDEHSNVGVVGPRLVLANGQLDLACRRAFPTPVTSFYRMAGLSYLFPRSPRFGRYNMTFLDEHETAEVDSVVGAFMLVRAAAIEQIGLLDDRFWMYGEDLDWAKRIKDRGWRVIYHPAVTVLHVKRASSRQNPRTQMEFYRAMLIFYYKHYYRHTPWFLHWLVLLGILVKGGRAILPHLLAGPAILKEFPLRSSASPPVNP